jgi:hypothetical protein
MPQFVNSIPLLPTSYSGRLASRNSTDWNDLLCHFFYPWARTAEKRQLLSCCMYSFPRKPIYSRCLSMNYSGFQASCHNIVLRYTLEKKILRMWIEINWSSNEYNDGFCEHTLCHGNWTFYDIVLNSLGYAVLNEKRIQLWMTGGQAYVVTFSW